MRLNHVPLSARTTGLQSAEPKISSSGAVKTRSPTHSPKLWSSSSGIVAAPHERIERDIPQPNSGVLSNHRGPLGPTAARDLAIENGSRLGQHNAQKVPQYQTASVSTSAEHRAQLQYVNAPHSAHLISASEHLPSLTTLHSRVASSVERLTIKDNDLPQNSIAGFGRRLISEAATLVKESILSAGQSAVEALRIQVSSPSLKEQTEDTFNGTRVPTLSGQMTFSGLIEYVQKHSLGSYNPVHRWVNPNGEVEPEFYYSIQKKLSNTESGAQMSGSDAPLVGATERFLRLIQGIFDSMKRAFVQLEPGPQRF